MVASFKEFLENILVESLHAEQHKITHYTFNATDKEPSRQSLYNTIARKYGGASADGGNGYREYIVPTGVNRD